ncbi:hypothetical protein [Pseudalkalibacillus decolorationis]|uniref:hypothetical protein n=1 Tax=Pseudalkalibacillus decolorationis TaxID=163879 RepID=UPI002148F50E|nr:hypothetical protein [Pseudalkalibacillus decolorationis]
MSKSKPISIRLDEKSEKALEFIQDHFENNVTMVRPNKTDAIQYALILYAGHIKEVEGEK